MAEISLRELRDHCGEAYDAMIAAICIATDLPLHACNADEFSRIDGLDLVDVPHPDG